MNRGGFSWARFLGISATKSRISKTLGVPLTKSGRQQKIGRVKTGKNGLLLFILSILLD